MLEHNTFYKHFNGVFVKSLSNVELYILKTDNVCFLFLVLYGIIHTIFLSNTDAPLYYIYYIRCHMHIISYMIVVSNLHYMLERLLMV